MKEPCPENNRKITIINEEKEEKNNEQKENDIENSKISMVIEELKDNLDSLGGAMNYIEQNEQEQNDNENGNEIINNDNNYSEDLLNFKNEIKKTINSLTDNFNSQLKRQNDYFLKAQKDIKEANKKKIEEIKKELNKKNDELNDIKKLLEEKICLLEKNYKDDINKLNEELKNIKNDSINNSNSSNRNIYSYVDKIKQDINSKINEATSSLNNIGNNLHRNNCRTWRKQRTPAPRQSLLHAHREIDSIPPQVSNPRQIAGILSTVVLLRQDISFLLCFFNFFLSEPVQLPVSRSRMAAPRLTEPSLFFTSYSSAGHDPADTGAGTLCRYAAFCSCVSFIAMAPFSYPAARENHSSRKSSYSSVISAH